MAIPPWLTPQARRILKLMLLGSGILKLTPLVKLILRKVSL
jgi:hypothetical protein